jgi:ribosomal protein L16 Arg81 hydroxylase
VIIAAGAEIRSAPAEGRFDLGWLVAPTEADDFWSSYWEREPLVIHRRDPSYYDGLLSLADVDHILATSAIRESDIRVIRRGEHTPVSELGQAALPGSSNRLEGLYREYRAGATVVIQALHERWGPLGRLCRNLARAVSGAAQVNVYLTPPGETGLLPHYDTHDVMVLQASGSKNWRIFGRPVDAPTKDQPYERALDPGEVTRDFVMETGDFMYLPRGFMHVAEARDQASLHLTVGIHPVTVGAVIRATVERAIRGDSRFRKALIPSFANDPPSRDRSVRQVREALDAMLQGADAAGAVDEAAKWAMVSEPPSLEGHLLDLAALGGLTLDTELQLRTDLAWRLDTTDEHLSITFNGKHVTMPDFVKPCLRHMASGDVFTIGSLPNAIDDEGKLVLAERLLREGFLTGTNMASPWVRPTGAPTGLSLEQG